jgi:hypothetical protein
VRSERRRAVPDNEQHTGSSSESVEDLVEKLNATAEAKEMLRELCVKYAESRQELLKSGLETLHRIEEKSDRKIGKEEVRAVAEVLNAEPFSKIDHSELDDIIKSTQLRRRKNSSKTPEQDPANQSGSDASPDWP